MSTLKTTITWSVPFDRDSPYIPRLRYHRKVNSDIPGWSSLQYPPKKQISSHPHQDRIAEKSNLQPFRHIVDSSFYDDPSTLGFYVGCDFLQSVGFAHFCVEVDGMRKRVTANKTRLGWFYWLMIFLILDFYFLFGKGEGESFEPIYTSRWWLGGIQDSWGKIILTVRDQHWIYLDLLLV